MWYKNKRFLVLGLGISGVSTAKALVELGASVVVSDSKNIDELTMYTEKLKGLSVGYCLGNNNAICGEFDYIIKSPGIRNDMDIIKVAMETGMDVITDIELASRIICNDIVAITGTNGKTTTTTLVGEIFKNAGYVTHVAGNIGKGVMEAVVERQDDRDIYVLETSSFQLENTIEFKPKVSVMINITPDHIDWHNGFENYVNAKKKIAINQSEEDISVLNYDDAILRTFGNNIKAKKIYFSQKEILENGIFLEGNIIKYRENSIYIDIIDINELQIIGRHNVENVMAAIGAAIALDIPITIIQKTLLEFKGVEHRVEFVKELNGIKYYNDSKGTNPDSTINAIEALKSDILLIAGGYDKGSDFDELLRNCQGKVKTIVLFGATALKIAITAKQYGYEPIMVENMEEAVEICVKEAKKNDKILLSPACASWGLYKNFEERGDHFKSIVRGL